MVEEKDRTARRSPIAVLVVVILLALSLYARAWGPVAGGVFLLFLLLQPWLPRRWQQLWLKARKFGGEFIVLLVLMTIIVVADLHARVGAIVLASLITVAWLVWRVVNWHRRQ